MTFLIGGANSASGYEISNSCRFNNGDSPKLSFDLSSPNVDKFTVSMWVKLGDLSSRLGLWTLGKALTGETGDYTTIDVNINSVGRLSVDAYDGVNDATVAAYNTAATGPIYRDPAAWYHFVFAFDTGDGTAGNRFKWYVNGSNQTANLATTTTPSQNADLFHASSSSFDVGYDRGNTSYHDGHISEVYYCDGYQYAASDFGETNDNGVWIPKRFTGSYGTNGIKLQFKETGTSANSSGIGADTGSEGNHMTPTNLAATDITVDTPTNNFCTYNLLATPSSLAQYGTFSEGNTTYTGHSNGSYGSSATGTFGVASGKWYWESKLTTDLSNGIGTGIRDIAEWNPDWANDSTFNHTDGGGDGGYAYNYNSGNPQRNNSESTTNAGSAISQNDIVMHAMDLDNGALYYGINGTWQASSDPESGASKTNAQHSFTVAGVYAPAAYSYSSRAFATNFGNPSFSISSGNADANGYGNFEYAVPSGYYALCTKNLADYG